MPQSPIAKGSTLHFLDINVSEIENHPSALQDMVFNRRFQGMIVRGVLPQDAIDRVVCQLEEDDGCMSSLLISKFAEREILPFKGPYVFGEGIVNTEPDLKKYFAYAAAFRQQCRTLFQGNPDFEERVESVFHNLGGGLPVRVPTGPEGQTYTSATIRVLPENHEIGIHVGNDFLGFPEAHHLKTLIDLADQLSFFIPLTTPEAGGELIVYALEWNAEERSRNKAEIYQLAERCESRVLAPGPGDMLLFNGGRYYHRVMPVLGRHTRRTIGGFVAFSHERDAVYYWS